MKKFLTYKGAVMTWECDSNGHMNVMYYINKFENAGRNLSLEMGVSKIMSKEIGFVVVEQTIKYLREVFEDDLLFVESSLVNFSNKANKINFFIKRKGKIPGTHSVIFQTAKETIELKHTAKSRDLFADGAINAAKWLANKKPGLYNMHDVLKIR